MSRGDPVIPATGTQVRAAVLGTGAVGRCLAARLAEIGHEVVIGTRDPAATRTRPSDDEQPSFAAWLDDHAGVELAGYAAAAGGADLVVNATAGAVSLDVLETVGADALEGVVLLDVANPLDFSSGFPPTLAIANDDSLAERIQRTAPGARVVKGLNTMAHEVMVHPELIDGPHEVFVAGDDADAKATVTELLVTFGWPRTSVIDLGPLRAARGTEMYLPLWIALMQALGTQTFNLHLAPARGPSGPDGG